MTSRISIIIPLYNQVEYTSVCLERLAAVSPGGNFQLVLVDNASTDTTPALCASMSGDVLVIRNEENLGFARACNQGANVATGEILLFLNNDTEPGENWLDPLLSVLDREPDVGAVGAKLLFPDGTLQHAGGVLVRNLRRSETPLYGLHRYYRLPADHPEANVRADVQFVTGAALAVRGRAFRAVGGFDERYWNGLEDVDLCLKLREDGWRVVYEPASCLVHHEGMSGPERRVRELKNIARLADRWLDKVEPDIVVEADGSVSGDVWSAVVRRQ